MCDFFRAWRNSQQLKNRQLRSTKLRNTQRKGKKTVRQQ